MPPIGQPASRNRPAKEAVRTRRASRALAAGAAAALLAVAVTACGNSSDNAGASTSSPTAGSQQLPTSLPTTIQDLDKWKQALKDGGWKNWDKDKWLSEARDFINPIIKGLWDPKRMNNADPDESDKQVPNDVASDAGKTDPEPTPVDAQAVDTQYSQTVPGVGKLFFGGPQGSMVCSATVVKDP